MRKNVWTGVEFRSDGFIMIGHMQCFLTSLNSVSTTLTYVLECEYNVVNNFFHINRRIQ